MAKEMKEQVGVGRRKTAIASVRLREGNGKVIINGKQMEEYFPLGIQQSTVLAPLDKLEKKGQYDLVVRVVGGGIEAQSIAVRLGLARALVKENEEVRHDLKVCGYLTRDPRRKERKKYGQPGARKRFQFSKR